MSAETPPPTETTTPAETTTPSRTGPPDGPPRGRLLILLAVVGAEFMLQLDGTIVNVALPGLRTDLGLGISEASWVVNGFFLAFAGLLLPAGRLGDLLGHRRLFLWGVGLVGAASLLAGLAPNLPVLVAGRALQGAGAAVAGPAGLALLTREFTGPRRARAFSLYAVVTGLGAVSGMLLGALLTWLGDWRWTLLVNVPVALTVVLLGARTLSPAPPRPDRRPAGLPGAALVVGALTALVYGLVRAADHGWDDTAALLCLGGALLLGAAWVTVDRRSAEPLVPPHVLAERRRAGGFFGLVTLAAVLTSFLFLMVQYLDAVLGLGPLGTGLAILPFGLSLLVTTQLLDRFLAGFGHRPRAVTGLAVVLLAVLWLTRLHEDSGYATGMLGPTTLLGIGVGLALVPLNLTILATTRPEDTGVTAGILQAALTVGGTLGLALLLVPYDRAGGEPGTAVPAAFDWSAGIAGLSLLTVAACWYLPGRAPRE